MSEHLDKAKKALEMAGDLGVDLKDDERLPHLYHRLLDIANVQAQVAAAEALERVAEAIFDIATLGHEGLLGGHQ